MKNLAQQMVGKTIIYEARDPKHWYNIQVVTFKEVLRAWKNKAEFLTYTFQRKDSKTGCHAVMEWPREKIHSLLTNGFCEWSCGVIKLKSN